MSQPSTPPVGGWWQPPPLPPKPEVPLRPAVWWSVAISAIYALGSVLFIVVFGALLMAIISSTSDGEVGPDLDSGGTAFVALLLTGSVVVSLAVGLGLTVGALLLLRMGSRFRTLPAFVQALLAALCAFVVSSIGGTALGLAGQLASGFSAAVGQ